MKPQGEPIDGLLWPAILVRDGSGAWTLYRRAFPWRWIAAESFPTEGDARNWIAQHREQSAQARAW
jgi:hypothetical protein